MCLILLAYGVDPDFPLIVAGNRDEFHARPTQDAHWWADAPDILGGRDLQAGGTWLGVSRDGRFATVTNFRDAVPQRAHLRSRGHLVTEFLQGELAAVDYLRGIDRDRYAGFNLFVADLTGLAFLSNRSDDLLELPRGVYGLSNAHLDSPWDKVARSKQRLSDLLADRRGNDTEIMRVLGDREKGPVEEAEGDRLPFALAHAITAPFVISPKYGTRSSTIVRFGQDRNWQFTERRFDASGARTGESRFSFLAGEYRE